MNQPTTFARHFSRLVWLLVNEPSDTDAQKGALRALAAVSKDGAVHLVVAGDALQVNGAPLADVFAGVPEVRARMRARGVAAMRIAVGASAADILSVARALASDEPSNGLTATSLAARLGLTTIRLAADMADREDAATPAATATHAQVATEAASVPSLLTETERPAADHPCVAGLELPPTAAGHAPHHVPGDEFLVQDTGAMFTQFMSASRPIDPTEVLFQRVDAAKGSVALAAPLEELVNVAEQNGRDGRAALMADIFAGLVKRESACSDDGSRRAFAMALKRISTSFMLKLVAGLLPRARSKADDYRAVLVRAGEDGADALIEQLTQAQTAEDRRAYFDVLLTLGEGVPALMHMLGDARWFVVRNAAELLGEMQAVEAEAELTARLRHSDERVRRAVKEALTRLGTPSAIRAIEAGLRDANPQLRQEAAAALAARRTPGTAQTLIRALENEEDLDVQLALLSALGKIGSADAVQRLQRAAEPEARLFRRKPTPVRLAAVQALAEVKSAPALAALGALKDDKEREVRELASRALAAAAREPAATA